jgi:hypothetical protein
MVINENPLSLQKILMHNNLLTQWNEDILHEQYANDDLSAINDYASDNNNHELDLAIPHGASNDEHHTQIAQYINDVYKLQTNMERQMMSITPR